MDSSQKSLYPPEGRSATVENGAQRYTVNSGEDNSSQLLKNGCNENPTFAVKLSRVMGQAPPPHPPG